MRLEIKVTPRAQQNKILPQPNGILRVYVTAAPTDNRATKAAIRSVADFFHIAPSKIKLLTGARSRKKILEF